MAKPKHELRRRFCAIEWTLFSGGPASAAEVETALLPLAQAVGPEAIVRAQALSALAEGRGDKAAYRDQYGVAGVRQFLSSGGASIYLFQIETFPDHVNNVYLVEGAGRSTLYDCGSQTASSREDFHRAEAVLKRVYGSPGGFENVHDVIVSHSHIDHFGGVGHFRAAGAKVYAHAFDARVVQHFEERIITAAMQVRIFLERAGLSAELRAELEQMYVFGKSLFTSVPVDQVLEDGDQVNGWQVIHVPGHCPGQMCLRVDDVLLTTDHVLPRITPHQSPESITPWTGLDHYFLSLKRVRAIDGIRLALPGHEEPIDSLQLRIDEIEAFHRKRLEEVRALCRVEPKNICQISDALFGEQSGYSRLLALEEAAAHTEYLERRGQLRVANLEELLTSRNPALTYRSE